MRPPFRLCLCLALAGLDPSARAAEAPTIDRTKDPVFPPGLRFEGVRTGEADLAISVDKTGALVDVLVTAYTRRQFADEAVRAVRAWRFSPDLSDGYPSGWVRELRINFAIEGIRVAVEDLERPAHFERTGDDDLIEYRARSLKELDRIPAPRRIVPPVAPAGHGGTVQVEFYIDEQGKVRAAGGRTGADPALVGAALAAVGQWEFEPPLRQGRPVLVRASQTFRFKPAAGAPAP